MSKLRRIFAKATRGELNDIVLHEGERYRLDPTHVQVDLWDLRVALNTYRSGVGQEEKLKLLEQISSLYRGDVGADLVMEWLEESREEVRRGVLDIFGEQVHEYVHTDSELALYLMERFREIDPYNEALYCDIARLQADMGHLGAASRTFDLLTMKLAQIDEKPTRETTAMFQALLRSS